MDPKAKSISSAFTATCGPGQHLEAIFNSVSDGIFALDTLLHVTRANRPALRITGYDEDEVLARACDEILSGELQGESLSHAIEKGQDIHEQRLVISTKSGGRRAVLVSTSPLRDQRGGTAGVAVWIR